MAEQEKPETPAGTDPQPSASAAENKQGQETPGAVESPAGQTQPDKKVGGVLGDLFKARERARASEAKASEFQQQLEAQKAEVSKLREQIENLSIPADDGYGNPAPAGQQADPRELARQAAEEVYHAQRVADGERASAAAAVEWLRTRSHLVSDPNAELEIAQRVEAARAEDELYGRKTDHLRMAKSVYYEWCEAKGISPDNAKAKDDAASRSATEVKPTASGGAGGGQTYTPKDIEKMFAGLKPGTAEYREKLAEMRQAKSEGRIKLG